jgi:hypothetical protein
MVPTRVVCPNCSGPESIGLTRVGFQLAARVLILLIQHVSESVRMPASRSYRVYKTFWAGRKE